MLLAAALAGAVGFAVMHFGGLLVEGGFAMASVLGAVLASLPVGLLMLVVYFATLAFLGVEESWQAFDGVRKALRGITRR
jgi:hypothetical protein